MVIGSVEHAKRLIDELPDDFDKKKVLEIILDIFSKHSQHTDEIGAAVLVLHDMYEEMAVTRMTVGSELARIKAGGNDE